jgi:hypothetical protein
MELGQLRIGWCLITRCWKIERERIRYTRKIQAVILLLTNTSNYALEMDKRLQK